ncbi:MAG: serine hydrolase domain-containing protein [Bacteroidota bacterium]
MKTKICLLILLSLFFSCQTQTKEEPATKYESQNEALTQKLTKAYERKLIKGFSVAVIDSTGTLFEGGFGFADLDTTKRYTAQTTQPIASISKVLIGLSLIKAEELNLLDLDDPVNKYLPFEVVNPKFPDTAIKIRHLAYHTSSIVDAEEIYFSQFFLEKDAEREPQAAEDYYEFFNKAKDIKPLEDYLQAAFSGEVYESQPFADYEPGTQREYSNIGADLCALIIQNAAKMDFRDFTKKYILAPLQMENTGWKSQDMNPALRSRLFVSDSMMITNYVQGSYPNGSFRASSHALGILLLELMNGYNGSGTLLSKEGYAKFYKKARHDDEDFGCFIEYKDEWIRIEDKMIGHDGSDPGVFTGMFFSPDRQTGKIIISNTDTDYLDDERIWQEISAIWKALIAYEKEITKEKSKK